MSAAVSSSSTSPRSRLRKITDLEMFAVLASSQFHPVPRASEPTYREVGAEKGGEMLVWAPNTEIQELSSIGPGPGYARIGTIGDGNCMVHSMFTAASPTYRSFVKRDRQKIADMFRDVLRERIVDIRGEVDAIYADIGGAGAIKDSFDNLADPAGRTEIDMELGPAIAHLYGYNFMAVTVNDALEMEPVCLTLRGYDSGRPTILINYIGGSTNIGSGSFVDMGGAGHFEVIIKPVFAAAAAATSASARTHRTRSSAKKTTTVTLDNFHTTYTFADATAMTDIMALFRRACGSVSSSSHRVSSGTLAAVSSVSSKTSSDPKKHSSPKTGSGPKTRKSSSSGRTVSPETLALLASINLKENSGHNTDMQALLNMMAPRKKSRRTTRKKRST